MTPGNGDIQNQAVEFGTDALHISVPAKRNPALEMGRGGDEGRVQAEWDDVDVPAVGGDDEGAAAACCDGDGGVVKVGHSADEDVLVHTFFHAHTRPILPSWLV